MSEGVPSEDESKRWFADWRVWLGLSITAISLWLAARDVPLEELPAAFRRADVWQLVLLSVPAHVLGIFVRALRWRYLTDAIAPMSRGLLYRAQSLGFLVNNLVPLRIGEFVRAWYLARESQTRGAAVLGTIVLERVLDIVSVLLMAGISLALLGAGAGEGVLAQGAMLMLPAAFIPIAGIVALRFAPERVLTIVTWAVRPLPTRVRDFAESNLLRFTEGLGALSAGSHLWWLLFYSLLIWLVIGVIPMVAGIVSFGVDLGGWEPTMVTSWLLLAGVGVAVAIPAAPGFVGPYQLAFTMILEPMGVPPATCLAMGLLVWFVFWCSFTFQGLIVMRLGGTSLAELTARAGKGSSSEHR